MLQRIIDLYRIDSPVLVALMLPWALLALGLVLMWVIRDKWTLRARSTVAALVLGVLPCAGLSIGFFLLGTRSALIIGVVLCTIAFFFGRADWVMVEKRDRAKAGRGTDRPPMSARNKVFLLVMGLSLAAYWVWVIVR